MKHVQKRAGLQVTPWWYVAIITIQDTKINRKFIPFTAIGKAVNLGPKTYINKKNYLLSGNQGLAFLLQIGFQKDFLHKKCIEKNNFFFFLMIFVEETLPPHRSRKYKEVDEASEEIQDLKFVSLYNKTLINMQNKTSFQERKFL